MLRPRCVDGDSRKAREPCGEVDSAHSEPRHSCCGVYPLPVMGRLMCQNDLADAHGGGVPAAGTKPRKSRPLGLLKRGKVLICRERLRSPGASIFRDGPS